MGVARFRGHNDNFRSRWELIMAIDFNTYDFEQIKKYTDAVNSLAPGALWNVNKKSNTLTWNSGDISQPTDDAIEAEMARLDTVYDGNAYQRTRANAYEKVKEQLDQLYHDMTAGKLDATGEWHKAIKAVKDATPKP